MPTGCSSVQISRGLPVLKVRVIGEDNKGVLGPTQVVPPVGESFHHGKQLSFVNVVVSLGWGKGGGVVCDRVKLGLPSFF